MTEPENFEPRWWGKKLIEIILIGQFVILFQITTAADICQLLLLH